MADSTPTNSPEGAPQVVYRRADVPAPASAPTPAGRELAPAVTPLIIGFTSLLIVISVLGYLSVQRIEEVGRQVLDLEHHQAAQSNLLLQLRLALNNLDNKARSRQDAEAGRGLQPPFDLPIRTARENVQDLLPQLDRPSLAQEPKWNQFRKDLAEFVTITEDSRRYSLAGFSKFHVVDTELNDLFSDASKEQAAIFDKSEEIQRRAARAIRLWSVIALIVGFAVAAGTVWEAQRRFRQLRQSMFELSRERSFTTQMIEAMVSAVVAIDQDDRIRSANRAFYEIFPGASVGALVQERFAPDDAMKMLEAATATKTHESGYRGRWVCALGSPPVEKSFDVYSSPLAIGGDQGQIISLVDVTEVAEAERVMRRNESLAAMGQATAQVAHEIKNPLGSIRLGVSMLRDNVRGDKEALRTIDLVERGVSHLNKLVVDVTEYSRRKPLSRSNVELTDLLNRSLELVAERIQAKGTPVWKKYAEGALRGSWDADQLMQVFVNVIANAVDASPNQHPIIVATQRVDGSGNGNAPAARIVISDQGAGMDRATVDRIFEPFFSTKKRGTGLGLAIVKQIIEQHGGTISVASEEGKGSSFTIDLPM